MIKHETLPARIVKSAKRLYQCEQGAEGLEKLLIIGAIVLPLLGLLMVFREEITEFVSGGWDDVQDRNDDFDPDNALN